MSSYIFIVLFLILSNTSHSQQPFLAIYYSYSEKSKDSHSTTENISLSGTTVVYSVKYTGRKGPDQKDERKECTLTNEQVSNIRKAISDKQLNLTDSLVDNSLSDNSYKVTTAITITVTSGNKTTKTKVKGSPSALGSKPIYKNSLYLLNLIRKMLDDCQ